MKKFTLLALLFAVLCGFTASAQTFSMDKGDTSKAYWSAVGTDVLVYNKIYNKTTSPIKIVWRVTNFHMDPGWTCGGMCDNILCYAASDDLVNGVISKTTDNIAAKSFISDMHVIFNGDAAAAGTWSYATISFTDPASGDDTTATFAAYKNAVGGITVTKVDDNVTLYPNPAQNYIDVLYSASSDVRTISVYNIIGKLVNVYKVSSNTSAHCEFNTDMPSGIYLVRLADSKGNIVATRKFTRQ